LGYSPKFDLVCPKNKYERDFLAQSQELGLDMVFKNSKYEAKLEKCFLFFHEILSSKFNNAILYSEPL